MDHIKIAQWAQIHSLYLPLYVAIEEGFFRRNGIEVELIQTDDKDYVFDYVADGRADFGVSDPTFCAMKKYKDVDAKILATLVDRVGFWGITHNPVIQPIKDIHDLVGLRIGCFPQPSTNYALITSIKERNKRLLSSMEIIEAPIGEQFDLLVNGEADIVLDYEPCISLAESKGHRIVYSYASVHGPYCFTGFYTPKSVLDEKEDVARRALKSLSEALKAMQDDADVALRTSIKLFPDYDPAILAKSITRLKREKVWKNDLKTDRRSWETAIQTRKDIGDKFIADIYKPIDNGLLGVEFEPTTFRL